MCRLPPEVYLVKEMVSQLLDQECIRDFSFLDIDLKQVHFLYFV